MSLTHSNMNITNRLLRLETRNFRTKIVDNLRENDNVSLLAEIYNIDITPHSVTPRQYRKDIYNLKRWLTSELNNGEDDQMVYYYDVVLGVIQSEFWYVNGPEKCRLLSNYKISSRYLE